MPSERDKARDDPDNELFELWRRGQLSAEDALAKAADPDRLAWRIVDHKRGLSNGDDKIEPFPEVESLLEAVRAQFDQWRKAIRENQENNRN